MKTLQDLGTPWNKYSHVTWQKHKHIYSEQQTILAPARRPQNKNISSDRPCHHLVLCQTERLPQPISTQVTCITPHFICPTTTHWQWHYLSSELSLHSVPHPGMVQKLPSISVLTSSFIHHCHHGVKNTGLRTDLFTWSVSKLSFLYDFFYSLFLCSLKFRSS